MRAIVLLDGEPRFRPFPFALPLDGPVGRAVADATRLLARTPGRFDGPIAFCHGIAPNGAILRRAGRYSEALVVFEEPSLAYRLGFALGVQLFVEREDGAVLFQQRAPLDRTGSPALDRVRLGRAAAGRGAPVRGPRRRRRGDPSLADRPRRAAGGGGRRERRHGLGARRLPRPASPGHASPCPTRQGGRAPLGARPGRARGPGVERHPRLLGRVRAGPQRVVLAGGRPPRRLCRAG